MIDRTYTAMLAWAMAHRAALAAGAVAIMLSMVPIYGKVLQEFVPSGVDEGEFEVGVTAPEGTSLSAMNEAMLAVEREIAGVPGVRVVLAPAGGGFLGGVNLGEVYVRLADHGERVFSWSRLPKGLVTLDPGAAFRGNASQGDVMRTVRGKLRKFSDLRASVRNVPSINLGGGRTELDLAIREPELQVRIDRARAADLQVETQDIATAWASWSVVTRRSRGSATRR